MANYFCSCRSNYFRVKDPEAFRNWIAKVTDVDVWDDAASESRDDVFAVYGTNPDGAGWPSFYWDEENDTEVEIDFFYDLGQFLVDGEVAIFMETGAEKLRYLIGYAVAVNNKGEMERVDLQDIYKMAAGLTDRPQDITEAEY